MNIALSIRPHDRDVVLEELHRSPNVLRYEEIRQLAATAAVCQPLDAFLTEIASRVAGEVDDHPLRHEFWMGSLTVHRMVRRAGPADITVRVLHPHQAAHLRDEMNAYIAANHAIDGIPATEAVCAALWREADPPGSFLTAIKLARLELASQDPPAIRDSLVFNTGAAAMAAAFTAMSENSYVRLAT